MAIERLGLVKTTLLDFPGHLAALVFTAGCNLRCPWCQNPALVVRPYDPDLVPVEDVMTFLDRRKRILQGVVVSGGEPLYHQDLPGFLTRIKDLGYKLKLDTNGTYPKRLKTAASGVVDYIAMDVKNAPSLYARSAGVPVDERALKESVAYVRSEFPESYEFRLTWVPGLNTLESLEELAKWVGSGAKIVVQGFRPAWTVSPQFAERRAATIDEVQAAVRRLGELGLSSTARV